MSILLATLLVLATIGFLSLLGAIVFLVAVIITDQPPLHQPADDDWSRS